MNLINTNNSLALHSNFISHSIEELIVQQTIGLGGLACKTQPVLNHPLETNALKTFGKISIYVWMSDDGEFLLVLRGNEITEVGFYLIDHDQTRLDGTCTVTKRTLFLYVDFHSWTNTLTGNLHQSELAERQDGVSRLVVGHLLTHKFV